MAEKKLIIKPHRYGGETAVVSMRLPKEMLAVIDRAAAETRSYLIRRKVKMRSALSVRGRSIRCQASRNCTYSHAGSAVNKKNPKVFGGIALRPMLYMKRFRGKERFGNH